MWLIGPHNALLPRPKRREKTEVGAQLPSRSWRREKRAAMGQGDIVLGIENVES